MSGLLPVAVRAACFGIVSAGALLLAGCFAPPAPFQRVDCWFDNSGSSPASCAWLRPSIQGASGETRLPVVILPGSSGRQSPNAVVYLVGGPGGESGFHDKGMLTLRMRQSLLGLRSDLVFYDQRGSGLSTPAIECPEWPVLMRDAETAVKPWQDRMQALFSVIATCGSRLPETDRHGALYSTRTAASDLRELVDALRDQGYGEVSVYGVSYGTRLAMEAALSQPLNVQRLVLDSVQPAGTPSIAQYPSDYAQLIDAADAHCRDDGCDPATGGLRGLLSRAQEQLAREPYRTTVTDPENPAARLPVRMDAEDVSGTISMAMLMEDAGVSWTRALEHLAEGKDDPAIQAMAQLTTVLGFELGINFIANILINCADSPVVDEPRMSQELARHPEARSMNALARETMSVCDRLAIPRRPDGFDAPKITVPSLLLSRRVDPLTPLHQAQRALPWFDDARLLVLPGSGHGVVDADMTMAGWVGRYLDGAASLAEIQQRYDERFADGQP